MRKIGLIPSRYGSSRLPGKPLLKVQGVPMVQRVYQQAEQAQLDELYVATDDARIADCVERFGGKYIFTEKSHPSGSDRVLEAATKLNAQSGDIIVNIQGDEPFLPPIMIKQVLQCFSDAKVELATLAAKIEDQEQLFNVNVPKVLLDKKGYARYFSRSAVPYLREIEKKDWLKHHTFYKHIGLYAYRFQALKEICGYAQSSWEKAEKLEQLRWLENGSDIKVAITTFESQGIDTEEDLKAANAV